MGGAQGLSDGQGSVGGDRDQADGEVQEGSTGDGIWKK